MLYVGPYMGQWVLWSGPHHLVLMPCLPTGYPLHVPVSAIALPGWPADNPGSQAPQWENQWPTTEFLKFHYQAYSQSWISLVPAGAVKFSALSPSLCLCQWVLQPCPVHPLSSPSSHKFQRLPYSSQSSNSFHP